MISSKLLCGQEWSSFVLLIVLCCLRIVAYTGTVVSGMPHGTFFRKGVITLENGKRLELTDLVVGGDIKMLGQEFFITDADEFTRKYFRCVPGRFRPWGS